MSEVKAVVASAVVMIYRGCEEWRTKSAIQDAACRLFKDAKKVVDQSLMNYMRLDWGVAQKLGAADFQKTADYPQDGKPVALTLFQAIAEPTTPDEAASRKRDWIDELMVLKSIVKYPATWSQADFIKLAQNQPQQAARLIFYYNLISFDDWTVDECAELWNATQWQELRSALVEKGIEKRIDHYCMAKGFNWLFCEYRIEILKYLLESQKVRPMDLNQLFYWKMIINGRSADIAQFFKKHGFVLNVVNDEGWTPLLYAVSQPQKRLQKIQTILAAEPDLEAFDNKVEIEGEQKGVFDFGLTEEEKTLLTDYQAKLKGSLPQPQSSSLQRGEKV